jgi:plastocyanin
MKLSLSRRRSSLAVAAALVLAVAGCGSSSSDSGAAAPATQAPASQAPASQAPASPAPAGGASSGAAAAAASAVKIQNFAFVPKALTVPAGGTVTWTFVDSTDHTVTSDDNSFASQPEGNGMTYSHTFPTAGTVPYHCSIHPFMKATITVK